MRFRVFIFSNFIENEHLCALQGLYPLKFSDEYQHLSAFQGLYFLQFSDFAHLSALQGLSFHDKSRCWLLLFSSITLQASYYMNFSHNQGAVLRSLRHFVVVFEPALGFGFHQGLNLLGVEVLGRSDLLLMFIFLHLIRETNHVESEIFREARIGAPAE